ncbi:MAG TPA: TlpA disulfide reductase family protein [Terracidiphilus sp.]|nr:TlpA disulfide reductase family protein [Terracidiphilus sp.]
MGSAGNRKSRSAVLLTALVACCTFPLFASGRRAPDLKLQNLEGQRQKLSALRGHVVVVNFWATWCGPCQEELPRLSEMAQAWAGKGVRFVAVSIDDRKDRAKIGPMLARLHVVPNADFQIWIGSNSDTLADFGLGEIVPGTVIIGPEGDIVARIMGEARKDDIRVPVDWLLNGRAGKAPAALVKRY